MIIVFDGPNKSGKTTIINGVAKRFANKNIPVNIVHWGPVTPDDRVYTTALYRACINPSTITIWDRSWASEFVYSRLYNRNRRIDNYPFLGEWLHRRMVSISDGAVYYVNPSDECQSKLDASDAEFSVDPKREKMLFTSYANEFDWFELVNDYSARALRHNVDIVVERALASWQPVPPIFGITEQNKYPYRVMFAGDTFWNDSTMPGTFLPYTTQRGFQLASAIGVAAFTGTWVDTKSLPLINPYDYHTVVCTDRFAAEYMEDVHMYYKPGTVHCFLEDTSKDGEAAWADVLIKFGNLFPVVHEMREKNVSRQ